MNKSIAFTIISIFASSITYSGIVESIDGAYANAEKSAEKFNAAYAEISAAKQAFMEGEFAVENVANIMSESEERNLILKNRLTALRGRLLSESSIFEKNLAEYKDVEASQKELAKILPAGERRIEYANGLIKEIRKISLENPGEAHSDRKYAESISSAYESQRDSLQSIMAEFPKLSAEFAVCQPQIEGIDTFFKTTKKHLEQAEILQAESKEKLDKLSADLDSILKTIDSARSEFLKESSDLESVRNNFHDEYLRLSIFVLNELPKSDKWANSVFENARAVNLPEVSVNLASSTKWEKSKVKKEGLAACAISNADARLQKFSTQLNGPVKPLDSRNAQAGVRAEILKLANAISALTRELEAAKEIFSVKFSEMRNAMARISTQSQTSSAILSDSITRLSDAQRLNSELTILAGRIDVAKAQSAAMLQKLKESLSKAKALTAEAKKYSEEMQKCREAASKEI